MTEQTTGRRLLAMVRPPKPPGQMTEEELDEFVEWLWHLIEQRLSEKERPST